VFAKGNDALGAPASKDSHDDCISPLPGYSISRRAASYVDRILRAEKPSDLPVQFPTKLSRDGPERQDRQGAESCHTPIDSAARG